MIYEYHIIFENLARSDKKKVRAKIKFIDEIIFLCFKFFSWKLIFSLSNYFFNNNNAILEIKIIYLCLRAVFRECFTSNEVKVVVPKNRSPEKKISYDFNTWNDIISRVLSMKNTLFFMKKICPLCGHILIARFAHQNFWTSRFALRSFWTSRFALGLVLFAYV